ncbi:MAG TPA: sulfate ABC transporter permease subunit CysW [Tepidiformaceae bacterium]|nr:sulfate ABC transporter permease subunit CysW [Tepidiformaceae bacterium]
MGTQPAIAEATPAVPPQRRTTNSAIYTEPRWVQFTLLGIALAFMGILIVVPVANIIYEALGDGWGAYVDSIRDPDTISALQLTLTVAAIVVPVNAVFGVAAAWAITKSDSRAKALLVPLIDLPLAVSPVVAGLIFIVIFGQSGYLGPWLREQGIEVVFATPGIAIATAFVTFPLVARALIPVMQDIGRDNEEAAITLGASGLRTFWHVTLPNVKWGLLNGIVLCNARAMGEFGAVAVVSGKITGKTDTLPLRIEKLDKAFDTTSAFGIATLLVGLALVTLVLKVIIEWRTGRQHI